MPIIYICDVCERKIGEHPLDRPLTIPQIGGVRVLCKDCATSEEALEADLFITKIKTYIKP